MPLTETKCHILRQLFEIGFLKRGQFLLRSGASTPVYIDLRTMMSYPQIISSFADLIWDEKTAKGLTCDVICGVPYAALPVATTVAVKNNFPMVLKRKEAKSYATKKFLEGSYKCGQKCLVIDDVMASGGSVLETVEVLRNEGLIVTDCIVLVDRQQGGHEILPKYGLTLHSLFTLKEMIDEALRQSLITESLAQVILQTNKHIEIRRESNCALPFSPRVLETRLNPVFERLLSIIERKQSNLCVGADVRTSADLIRVAEAVGPFICLLKTRVHIVEDFSDFTASQLSDVARKHDFLIMEDRQFADTGNIVALQYASSPYKIKDWADIVTVHCVSGDGVVLALKGVANGNRACVLVAEMSSGISLADERYRNCTLEMAKQHREFVIGFVGQSRFGGSDVLHLSPFVNLSPQQRSQQEAEKTNLVDIFIVGKDVTEAENVAGAARLYQQRAFTAYKENLPPKTQVKG